MRALRETLEQSNVDGGSVGLDGKGGATPPEVKFVICFSLWLLVLAVIWALNRETGEARRFTY